MGTEEQFNSPYAWQSAAEGPLYQERYDPAFRTRWGKVMRWIGFKSPNEQ